MNGKRKTSILLIDPDGSAQRSLSLGVGKDEYLIKVTNSSQAALDILDRQAFDIALIADLADQATVPETVKRIRLGHLYTEVILLGESSDDKMAVEALRAGAFDCINKPFSSEYLWLRLGKTAEHGNMRKELTALQREIAMDCAFDNIVGVSAAITKLKETIKRIAPTDIPVLITGAMGTGKGFLARVIHHHSDRRRRPFVSVDCSGVDGAQLEKVLFGPTEDGNSLEPRELAAALEKADHGSLFLDAVDRMPLPVQTKLSCFLRDFKLEASRPGADRKIDVRVITATEKNLGSLVAEGKFREDLLNRLGVVSVEIPALAERTEDIEMLTDYLLRRIAADFGRKQLSISRQAVDKLVSHTWPGNVRELQNCLRQAVVHCNRDYLDVDDIILGVSNDYRNPGERMSPGSASIATDSLLEDNQRVVIRKALANNNWNFSQTAQALGIGRTTLWRKVKKYNLKRDTVPS